MKLSAVVLLLAVGVAAYLFATALPPPEALGLAGKRVVVCGASTGIGEETALLYARLGAKIVIAARRRAALEDVAARCKEAGAAEVHVLTVDFSEMQQCADFIAEAARVLGGIDVLVLNHIAGFWGNWGINGRLDVLQTQLQVNTVSYITLATYAMPHLHESNGTLAVVSSMAGHVGLPKVAPYTASKHALHGFFESLRTELAHNSSSVSVSICVLGNIDTPNARATTGTDVDHLTRYPASGAAESIVVGTAARKAWVYYPWLELRPAAVLHALFPETMDALLRFIIYRD